MSHYQASPVDCSENAHLVYRRQCDCCGCVLLCLAWLERPGARPATISLVQNHFEVVPLSHVGVAGRCVLSKGKSPRRLSWRRLSDIYPHAGARTTFRETAVIPPHLNCPLPYPSATLISLPFVSADFWSA